MFKTIITKVPSKHTISQCKYEQNISKNQIIYTHLEMGLTLASIMVKHLQHFMFSGNSCTPKKSEKKKNKDMSS